MCLGQSRAERVVVLCEAVVSGIKYIQERWEHMRLACPPG